MNAERCVCCGEPSVTDIEVSLGLWVGVCPEHLARRNEADARRQAAALEPCQPAP